jgi:hypothetical protein
MDAVKRRLKQIKPLRNAVRSVRDWQNQREVAKERQRYEAMGYQAVFNEIFETNGWRGEESVSGRGSDKSRTRELVARLPQLLREYRIGTLLDLPCGDFHWMADVDLSAIRYIGADIVDPLVERNQRDFGMQGREFRSLDLMRSELPDCDLLLCRDCLVHLSYQDVFRALANIRQANVVYLLTTTFPAKEVNTDIVTGEWRALNLERPPFCFPPPLSLLVENNTDGGEAFRDKALGLWRVSDLAHAIG